MAAAILNCRSSRLCGERSSVFRLFKALFVRNRSFDTTSTYRKTIATLTQAATAGYSPRNDFMKLERFSDALESYSQAIRLDSRNAVYFCNRAAAYSKLNKNQQAIDDCNRALAIDPGYSKAYGRMGIAFTAQENHESAYECFRKALELDPNNQSYKNNLAIAEQKMKEAAARAGFNLGPAGSLGALGPLGNVDFSSLFSDPDIVNMATTVMSNPQMQQVMSNFMTGSNPGAGNIADLLQASQQMASQMQQANPHLFQQLREQLGGLNQAGNNSSAQNNTPDPNASS